MKLSTAQVEFIKNAHGHSDVCMEWKGKIADTFPELFPRAELEAGRWYKVKANYDWLIFLESINPNKMGKGYGFDLKPFTWHEKLDLFTDMYNWQPATKQEIESALVEEAKRRGFKDKQRQLINAEWLSNEVNTTEADYYFDGKTLLKGNYTIFKNGVFATIIEDEKQTRINELEKQARVILKEIEEIKSQL